MTFQSSSTCYLTSPDLTSNLFLTLPPCTFTPYPYPHLYTKHASVRHPGGGGPQWCMHMATPGARESPSILDTATKARQYSTFDQLWRVGASAVSPRVIYSCCIVLYNTYTFRLLFDSMDRSPDGQTGGVLVNWARAVDPTFTNIPSYVRLDLVVFCSPFIPPILALSPFPPLFPFPPLSQHLHFNT